MPHGVRRYKGAPIQPFTTLNTPSSTSNSLGSVIQTYMPLLMHSENHPISRRAALAGAGAFFIPAWNEKIEAAETITCTPATPTVTEGPYWVDEKLFRSDIRTDPSPGTSRDGVPLTLVINVQNLSGGSCTALAGAYVDIWHCDAKGIYSDESTYNPGGGTGSVNTKGQKFLRGYQVTDDNGQVRFATIYPGWYAGRTIHIHMRVRTYSGNTVLSNFVSQIFFDEAINDTVMAQSAYRAVPRATRGMQTIWSTMSPMPLACSPPRWAARQPATRVPSRLGQPSPYRPQPCPRSLPAE